MNLTIELPWPAKELSPNARPHWAAKSASVRLARQTARLTMLAELNLNRDRESLVGAECIRLRWTFHPPSRRSYDKDNLQAQMKSYQDGIADALDVNDSKFDSVYEFGEVLKGGKVIVEIGDSK